MNVYKLFLIFENRRDMSSSKFNEFQFGKIFGMKDAYEHILQMINEIEEAAK